MLTRTWIVYAFLVLNYGHASRHRKKKLEFPDSCFKNFPSFLTRLSLELVIVCSGKYFPSNLDTFASEQENYIRAENTSLANRRGSNFISRSFGFTPMAISDQSKPKASIHLMSPSSRSGTNNAIIITLLSAADLTYHSHEMVSCQWQKCNHTTRAGDNKLDL